MKKTYDEFLDFTASLLEGLGKKDMTESFVMLRESYPEYTDMMLTELAILDDDYESEENQMFH